METPTITTREHTYLPLLSIRAIHSQYEGELPVNLFPCSNRVHHIDDHSSLLSIRLLHHHPVATLRPPRVHTVSVLCRDGFCGHALVVLQQREGKQRSDRRQWPGNEQCGELPVHRTKCEQREGTLLHGGEKGGLRERRGGRETASTTISCHSVDLLTTSEVRSGVVVLMA